MADHSNDEVFRELKAGSKNAFEKVFKQYYHLLCFEARGYIRANHLVEEIVCDVFTRLWQNREKIVITTSLREYLVKSVHNNCIDYYRNQKVHERLKLEIKENQKVCFTLADLDENPLEYMVTRELEDRIEKAIESLPDQYKRAFKLSRFNDLTYDEIAIEMGLSVNSVKTNIKNALAALRKNLTEFFSLIAILLLKSLF